MCVLQVLLVYDLKENLRTIHIYNSFVNCRFVGSIWLWMRAIVWRTTTVNWPKHWTPIILHRSVSYWLVHHFRIDCLSCGLWWISFSPVFLIPRPLSNHGLTHRSRWQERKLNWMKKKLFLLSVVCTRYLFFLLRDLIDIYSICSTTELTVHIRQVGSVSHGRAGSEFLYHLLLPITKYLNVLELS